MTPIETKLHERMVEEGPYKLEQEVKDRLINAFLAHPDWTYCYLCHDGNVLGPKMEGCTVPMVDRFSCLVFIHQYGFPMLIGRKRLMWFDGIKSIDEGEPHSSYGGWRGFLNTCEVRGKHDGVLWYGATNSHYFLFPDGTLTRNHGFEGQRLMNEILCRGGQAVLEDLTEARRLIADSLRAGKADMYRINEELDKLIETRQSR